MQSFGTTALRQFARLETIGLWRASPDAQRREVVVSFGEATLMIADGSGRPLTHWSLPAIRRVDDGALPALYVPDSTPGDAPSETLEINDPLMVEALEKIRSTIAEARPHSGLLRRRGIWLVAGLVLAIAVFWMPPALERQALALVPQATRVEIGATIIGLMQRQTGPACRSPAGTAALAALVERLYGPESGISVLVLPGDMGGVQRLPGGLVAVPRAALASIADPFDFAGDIVAAIAANLEDDPLRPVLQTAGLRATVTLLVTGKLPSTLLEPLAVRYLAQSATLPDIEVLEAAFTQARLPLAPWAEARLPAGSLPEGAATASALPEPVMTDAEWISLQGICSL